MLQFATRATRNQLRLSPSGINQFRQNFSTAPFMTYRSRDTYGSDSRDGFRSRDRDGFRSRDAPRSTDRYGSSAKLLKDYQPAKVRDNVIPPNVRLSGVNLPEDLMPADEAKKWRTENAISIEGEGQVSPIVSFDSVPFHPRAVAELKRNYPAPLAIQAQGWAQALAGKNMIGVAKTGSGKTLAFVMPALEHIKNNKPCSHASVLVLAPSRELAQQIATEFNKYSHFYNVRTACLFGGQGNRSQQMNELRRDPQVLVATPGRLNDFVNQGMVSLQNVHFLVLDEADRMLEMGMEEQVREILNTCAPDRQTQMWTATWPKGIRSLAADYFKDDFVKVIHGSDELTANPDIEQKLLFLNGAAKLPTLCSLIEENKGEKMIIFVGTKLNAAFLESRLMDGQFDFLITSLHGDKSQPQRDAILADFRSGILKIVVATDVASRGIDVKDINIVINYDLPGDIESYIHRIGRTARAGKKGRAYSFFTPDDKGLAQELLTVMSSAGQAIPPELYEFTRRRDHRSDFRGGKSRGGGSRSGGGRGGSWGDRSDRGGWGDRGGRGDRSDRGDRGRDGGRGGGANRSYLGTFDTSFPK